MVRNDGGPEKPRQGNTEVFFCLQHWFYWILIIGLANLTVPYLGIPARSGWILPSLEPSYPVARPTFRPMYGREGREMHGNRRRIAQEGDAALLRIPSTCAREM